MKIEIEIILEAIQIIKDFPNDKEVIKNQCNIILKSAKEIKEKYL